MRVHVLIGALLIGAVVSFAQAPQTMGQPRTTAPTTNPTVQPGMTGDTMPARTKVDDKKFIREAAIGGMTEVALGKLAAEKGSSDGVKQFGQKMVDDHSKGNEELKKLATAQSVEVPDSLDSKHQARVDKLSKLSGPAFDKAYIKDQVKDHQQDVREFQDEAQNGSEASVKSFAAKTLPTLQEHLSMAKDLSKGKNETASADRSKQ